MMIRNVRFTEIVWVIDLSPNYTLLVTEGKQSIGLCSIEFDWFGNRTHTTSAVRLSSISERSICYAGINEVNSIVPCSPEHTNN